MRLRRARCRSATGRAGSSPGGGSGGASAPTPPPTNDEDPRRRGRRGRRPGGPAAGGGRDVDQVAVVDADPVAPGGGGRELGREGGGRHRGRVRGRGAPGRAARAARWRSRAVTSRPGTPVVSTSDSIDDVRGLLDLDAEARLDRRGRGGGRGVLTGLLLRARAPRGRRVRSRERGARGPQRHRRTLRAPASTTPPSPDRPSTGGTATGSAARPDRAASCAGSPTRSAPRTATGPSSPTRCSSSPPSPASSG